ncbi:MAG: hypothetical protein MZV70_71105 [Desulfobacterales bacterium]|nr:hypothetical protein [Desulfobacterales bacterium]
MRASRCRRDPDPCSSRTGPDDRGVEGPTRARAAWRPRLVAMRPPFGLESTGRSCGARRPIPGRHSCRSGRLEPRERVGVPHRSRAHEPGSERDGRSRPKPRPGRILSPGARSGGPAGHWRRPASELVESSARDVLSAPHPEGLPSLGSGSVLRRRSLVTGALIGRARSGASRLFQRDGRHLRGPRARPPRALMPLGRQERAPWAISRVLAMGPEPSSARTPGPLRARIEEAKKNIVGAEGGDRRVCAIIPP